MSTQANVAVWFECVLASWHMRPNIHTAPAVKEPNDSPCNELQWIGYTCIPGTPMPRALRTVGSSVLPIVKVVSLVASNATTPRKLSWEKRQKQHTTCRSKKTETYHLGTPGKRNSCNSSPSRALNILGLMPTQNNDYLPHVCAALCNLVGQKERILVEQVAVDNARHALHTCSDLGLPAAARCRLGHVPCGNEIRVHVTRTPDAGFHDARGLLEKFAAPHSHGVVRELSVPCVLPFIRKKRPR